MPFSGVEDINTHLPKDKAQILDAQAEEYVIDADRLIRARLAAVVEPSIMATWTTPEFTPEIIRQISGKLVASKFYATLVVEDDADGSKYALDLYNEAIADLEAIRTGAMTIIGVDGTTVVETSTLDETMFLPNDTTQDPFFAVADQWS